MNSSKRFSIINFWQLVISLAVPLIVGGLTGLVTSNKIDSWYAGLVKPFFNPPNWLFAPAWTVLYILMGIALFLVLKKGLKKAQVRFAVYIFAAQILLNGVWTLIFFGLESPGWALFEIIFLLLAILLNILFFGRISRLAGYLLIPYILWVCFATALNIGIFILNH